MAVSAVIETQGLRKTYGRKIAVDDLTLQVAPGEIFGLIGPNGAGKTTSVKMLLGLAVPTAGEGRLLGMPLGRPQARARVGFLPEHFRFYDWLSARELLTLHAELYGLQARAAQPRITRLLELVDLAGTGPQPLRTFSKGMLQRLGLAQALLNEPEVVILDEPTSGLDPLGRIQVREVMLDLRKRGVAVLLNSHLLSEVERTCDRVAFIKAGKVVHVEDLHASPAEGLRLELRTSPLSPETLQGLANWSTSIQQDDDHLLMSIAAEAQIPEINRYLVAQGAQVFALIPERVPLEELFLRIMGDEGGF